MTLPPFVSALTPTYNRYPDCGFLVEEAVECFLRQDYPPERRELIVWNDTPGQYLTWDKETLLRCNLNPDYIREHVKIINTPRFQTLGEKRNALVGVARGYILLPWDDDDLALENRISQAVSMMCPRGGILHDYWNPRHYWYMEGSGLNVKPVVPSSLGYAQNASAFTRRAFNTVRGYDATSGDEDAKMDHRLRKALSLSVLDGLGTLAPEAWSYIYRWGVSPRHLSGVKDCNQHYQAIGEQSIQKGTFVIRPHWRRDYTALVREATEKLRQEQPVEELCR